MSTLLEVGYDNVKSQQTGAIVTINIKSPRATVAGGDSIWSRPAIRIFATYAKCGMRSGAISKDGDNISRHAAATNSGISPTAVALAMSGPSAPRWKSGGNIDGRSGRNEGRASSSENIRSDDALCLIRPAAIRRYGVCWRAIARYR